MSMMYNDKNMSMMYLLNFCSESDKLCMFIAKKALFCCGNCIVKANEKMDSSLYIRKQCSEQQSVLLSSFVVCCDCWNLLFSHTK